jgi:hypothetical protein
MSDGPVFLHIGLMKTGTSYLQGRLRAAPDELARQGLTMLPEHQPAAHQLALALRGKHDPAVDRRRGARALDLLPRQIDRAPGDRCLISEETLCFAGPERLELLGAALADRELRVIVTVRDIARTIPSIWQQRVRGGRRHSLDRFADSVVERDGRASGAFWSGQELVAVLDRWEALVPRQRMHVVVVPPSGAAGGVLLERFCSVVGIEPTRLPPAEVRANPSLGWAQAELMRRVNALLPGDLRRRDVRGTVVNRGFVMPVLGPQPGEPIRLPGRLRDWCHEYAVSTIKLLEDGGYAVVGDPQDLLPRDEAFTAADASVPEHQVADAAVRALADLLTARGQEWIESQAAHAEAAEPIAGPAGAARGKR